MIDYLQKARIIADKLAATSQATEDDWPCNICALWLGAKI